MSAICPHCESTVTSLAVNPVEAKDPNGQTWKAATFACPNCDKVLGASFDATAQTVEIIAKLEAKLDTLASAIKR
jgi:hypothetical protein